MKFRIHGMFLSLFFALAVCFSFSIEASAHEYKGYTHPDYDISAADVDVANEAQMKDFTLHLATHIYLIAEDPNLDDTEETRELVILGKRFRERSEDSPNVFNHGDVYSLGLNSLNYITNHSLYPDLYGSKYIASYEFENADGRPTGDTIETLLGAKEFPDDTTDPTTCVSYHYDGKNRVACAIKQHTVPGLITGITGFHHSKDDSMIIDPNDPDCDQPRFTLVTSAETVNLETDPEEKIKLVEEFVKEVVTKIKARLVFNTKEVLDANPGIIGEFVMDSVAAKSTLTEKLTEANFSTLGCLTGGDFKDGPIYAFINEPGRGVAVLNGLDPDIHGLSVSLTDPDPINQYGDSNVLHAFLKTVTTGNTGSPEHLEAGNNGWVRYHWHDPDDDTDDRIDNSIETNCVPGKSVKDSYIEVIDSAAALRDQLTDLAGFPVPVPEVFFIVGSGYYPEGEENTEKVCEAETGGDDNGGGCAVATTGNTHQSALLNLFLIASVLFSAVFLRNRV